MELESERFGGGISREHSIPQMRGIFFFVELELLDMFNFEKVI
jgi:hypothetical protein